MLRHPKLLHEYDHIIHKKLLGKKQDRRNCARRRNRKLTMDLYEKIAKRQSLESYTMMSQLTNRNVNIQ